MVRIRYYKQAENKYSSKPLITSNHTLIIHLNTENCSAKITSYETREVLKEITSDSLNYLKRKIRSEVIKLGKHFTDDIRKKRPKDDEMDSVLV